MMEELNMKKLQAENNYLDYKINNETNLLVTTDFKKEEERLLKSHIAKMIDRKIMNEKIMESVKE